jgi:hypothetical protein
MTSDFRRVVREMYALLEYYAEESGNSLPTFRENLSVPSARFEKSKKNSGFWVMTNLMHSFLMYLFYASTCFEQQVLVIRRVKLY